MITRCDEQDIEFTSEFLLQKVSLKVLWMFETKEN